VGTKYIAQNPGRSLIHSQIMKYFLFGVNSKIFLSAIVCSSVAHAAEVSLSPAVFYEGAGSNNLTEPYPSETEFGYCIPGYGCGSSKADTEDGNISTSVTAETNGNSAGASAAANIKYQFSVTDPTAEYVQVNITADVAASAVSTVTSGAEGVYNNAYASAYSDVSYSASSNTPLGAAYGMVVASATTGGKVSSETQNQSLNASFYVLVNSVASVNVYSWCDDSSFGGTSTCNAYVDPIVKITPAFLTGNPEANLIFSSGIHQVIGVPESSTWAMLVVGFGGLGYAGWRRRSARRTVI
jgi:hypothetical protein